MAELHPFQTAGALHLAAHRHAYLADEMGLGKTTQAIAALSIAEVQRALIICPAIVESAWVDAFALFAPHRPPPHTITAGRAIPAHGDLIISYDRATAYKADLQNLKYNALICDEAHALKDPTAQRTRAILNPIRNGAHSYAARAEHCWLLSGTPMPNNAAELWPALKTAGLVEGRFWDFAHRFCQVSETPFGRRIGSTRNAAELRQLLSTYMLRRTVAEVLPELPPLTVDTLTIPAAEIDAANPILPALQELEQQSYSDIAACIAAGDFAMMHVPHIATIRRLTGLAKAHHAALQARAEIEFGCAEKVVLFGLHTAVLDYLAHALAEFNPITLAGHVPPVARREGIRRFQTDPRCRIAIGQNKAAGAGITLTASNRLLLVEPAWSPADNQQIVKRVHRIGQTKPTSASVVSLEGSSDAKVNKVLAQKIKSISEVLDIPLAPVT